ncbi:MAG: hypothetical protein ABFS56_33580, partial [Pseudomonadota bacterium]
SLKLTENNIKPILKQIQPSGNFIKKVSHIQIIKGNKIQVLIGDNFHNECISVGPLVTQNFLSVLKIKGLIRYYYTSAEVKSKY